MYENEVNFVASFVSLSSETIIKQMMNMEKQTIQFDMELFQGYTCIGCAVVNDLAIEVEFTDEEIAQMKQLVSQIEDEDYSQGIMPVLKDAAPELYKRIEDAARSEIIDFLYEDGISQGYIEFDDDELRRNFLKDYNLTEEDYDQDLYYDWYNEEMARIRCSSLRWIRSRYSIDDQVSVDDYNPNYTVDIPVEILPE